MPPKPKENELVANKEYVQTFVELKKQIQTAQLTAMTIVNTEMIRLYWKIGKTISIKQEENGWGTSLIERLAKDLQNEFPGVEGFSRTNVFRMRAFYRSYQKVPQAVGQIDDLPIFRIPWGHNILLIERVKNQEACLWYAEQSIVNGWSRSALEDLIEAEIYARQGKAITNFSARLTTSQSQLAQETLKDPYSLDFLTLRAGYLEKELEQGLVDHIQKFLIELGHGFAFVGRQFPLEVDGDTCYIDLLFYHTRLHCYIAVELKREQFKPDYVGQMNYYLSALDEKLKTDRDDPSIGLILCKYKSKIKVEYALRDIKKPIGVAGYVTKIMKSLPESLEGSLPTIEEIEAELEKDTILK